MTDFKVGDRVLRKLSEPKLMILWRVACNEIPDDWQDKWGDEHTVLYWMLNNLYIGYDVTGNLFFLDDKGKEALKRALFDK